METAPHKSTWKERKKGFEELDQKKEEASYIDTKIREKLSKIKKNMMIVCILLVGAMTIGYFIVVLLFLLSIIAIFIGVFNVYYPISDILKKPEK